ncbi:nuclear transport factor 2 family protein [Parasphingorhabdus sp.]|uniref:nuclear transport factor 2 family protein n=1 Tax=Parasphingorhabdus sp. TaxID=2709688 RepID=UPI00326567AC
MIAPIDVTKNVFEAFGAHDVDTIVQWLHRDIEVEFYGPDVIPYARTWKGLPEARKFFETVLSSVDIHQFDPEEFICEGNKVVVTGHLRLTAKSTGKGIESDFAHVITVADGKWLRFRDFMNTVEAANAFSA